MIWPTFTDPVLSSRLCLTLLHSLWQVTLFALAAHAAGRLWRRRSVERDYAFQVAALLASLVAMSATFVSVSVVHPRAAAEMTFGEPAPVASNGIRFDRPLNASTRIEVARSPNSSTDSTTVADSPSPRESGEPFWVRLAPWIASLYGIGVLLMLSRLGISVWHANRISERGKVLRDGPLAEFVRAIAAKWSMLIVPVIVRVDEIFIPKVVGLIWPKILLPASALTGLSAADLELILIHELAHLRRHDMWVNLLQRLAEAVLFFNPAAWYLSKRIATLREFCCDEMTCRTMAPSRANSRTDYALALLHVVELARHSMELPPHVGSSDHDDLVALAVSGRTPSQLRHRIASLFGEPVPDPLRLSAGGMLTAVALALLLLFGPALWPMTANSAGLVPEKSVVRQIFGDRDYGSTKNTVLRSAEAAPSLKFENRTGSNSSKPGSPFSKDVASNDAESTSAKSAPPKSPRILEPVFILANHLMLHEDRVITWDGIRDLLKKMAHDGPIHPSFQFTNGALDQWSKKQQQAFQLRKEIGFDGFSIGSLSPRASRRYDAIRSPEDLKPDQSKRRKGNVRRPDGSPADDAEVVLLPNEAIEVGGDFTVYLKDGQIRQPYLEISTKTDATGQFTVYPGDRFQLVVLHKAGFALVSSEQFHNDPVITLRPWVRIIGTIDRSGNPKQSVYVTSTPKKPHGWPSVRLSDYGVVVSKNGSFDTTTPPGDILVQRSVPGDQGMSYSLPVEPIHGAKPGSEHRVVLGPLTADDFKLLDSLRK
jgi:beta-lactamase regulating signal transducer with metallopeptidase domain